MSFALAFPPRGWAAAAGLVVSTSTFAVTIASGAGDDDDDNDDGADVATVVVGGDGGNDGVSSSGGDGNAMEAAAAWRRVSGERATHTGKGTAVVTPSPPIESETSSSKRVGSAKSRRVGNKTDVPVVVDATAQLAAADAALHRSLPAFSVGRVRAVRIAIALLTFICFYLQCCSLRSASALLTFICVLCTPRAQTHDQYAISHSTVC
jgi:hypothetical protein